MSGRSGPTKPTTRLDQSKDIKSVNDGLASLVVEFVGPDAPSDLTNPQQCLEALRQHLSQVKQQMELLRQLQGRVKELEIQAEKQSDFSACKEKNMEGQLVSLTKRMSELDEKVGNIQRQGMGVQAASKAADDQGAAVQLVVRVEGGGAPGEAMATASAAVECAAQGKGIVKASRVLFERADGGGASSGAGGAAASSSGSQGLGRAFVLVLVTLDSTESRMAALRGSARLGRSDSFRQVFISEALTSEQQATRRRYVAGARPQMQALKAAGKVVLWRKGVPHTVEKVAADSDRTYLKPLPLPETAVAAGGGGAAVAGLDG